MGSRLKKFPKLAHLRSFFYFSRAKLFENSYIPVFVTVMGVSGFKF